MSENHGNCPSNILMCGLCYVLFIDKLWIACCSYNADLGFAENPLTVSSGKNTGYRTLLRWIDQEIEGTSVLVALQPLTHVARIIYSIQDG